LKIVLLIWDTIEEKLIAGGIDIVWVEQAIRNLQQHLALYAQK